jgi:hypothetical protein
LAGVRIEEGVGFGSCGDAAREEKLSEDLRKMSRLGESRCLFCARLCYLPALERSFGWMRREGNGQRE